MLEFLDRLTETDPVAFFGILAAASIVSICCLRTFIRHPLGWYRGFQSTPVFQFALWILASPFILPLVYLYLRRRRALGNARFIGNVRSRVFHWPQCEHQRRIFLAASKYPLSSSAEATDLGFRPCRWCSPR